jgi:hypothetical protein
VNLSETTWTLVAHSYRDHQGRRMWITEDGSDIDDLFADGLLEKKILMQRRKDAEWQIMARLPCPGWRKIQRWRVRNPLEVLPPHLRKVRA